MLRPLAILWIAATMASASSIGVAPVASSDGNDPGGASVRRLRGSRAKRRVFIGRMAYVDGRLPNPIIHGRPPAQTTGRYGSIVIKPNARTL